MEQDSLIIGVTVGIAIIALTIVYYKMGCSNSSAVSGSKEDDKDNKGSSTSNSTQQGSVRSVDKYPAGKCSCYTYIYICINTHMIIIYIYCYLTTLVLLSYLNICIYT